MEAKLRRRDAFKIPGICKEGEYLGTRPADRQRSFKNVLGHVKIIDVPDKLHITGMSRGELEELFLSFGEPKYRATQVFKAVHERRLRSFDEITDLPKKLRLKLEEVAEISQLTVESLYVSVDGTRRYLMQTANGSPVETVFLPTENRDTICFSSQSGCPLKCDFCLTGKLGLIKNLTVGEIVEQIIIVLNDVYGVGGETPHGTNLVGMGAGEPFLNYENLIVALRLMADEDGLFIVPNRVTISTAGIVPRIYDFARLDDRPHLAISLSSALDEQRDKLMPINKRWDLRELMMAAKEFEGSLRRGERFTFEYVMLGGVNDSDAAANELVDLLGRFQLSRVKINLIPHNGAAQLDYIASTPERIARFKSILESRGVSAYVRTPRGRDIFAACGQLAATTAESSSVQGSGFSMPSIGRAESS
ncbi:MAG: 23S rRNA (adenine(2503)-C(2))-methyltransferase RlmN [Pyrinomonadaceae bacterium]